MNTSIKFIILIVSILCLTNYGENSLYNYSLDILIQDLAADSLAKIETYVYLEPNDTTTTFMICIATLSTNQQVYIEKRKFTVGETGLGGPEKLVIANQYNSSKQYKDIDIVNGPKDCIFAAISTENLLSIGTGETPFPSTTPYLAAERIEVVGPPEAPFLRWLQGPSFTLAELRLFGIDHSMDAILLPNGGYISALSSTPQGSQVSVAVWGNDVDDAMLYDVAAVDPSIVAFPDSSILVCGEDDYTSRGIVCDTFPPGGYAVNVRSNNATATYHRPIISMLNSTSLTMCLASIVTNADLNSTLAEIAVLDNGQFVTGTTRPGANLIHAAAINDYIFATYATPAACKLDVLYYSDTPPIYPTPIAAPVSPPTATEPPTTIAPVPGATPVAPPSSSPMPSPIPSTNQVPQAEGGKVVSNVLTPQELGAAIGVPIGVASLAVGLLALLLLLRKRRRKDKKNSAIEIAAPAGTTDPESSSSSEASEKDTQVDVVPETTPPKQDNSTATAKIEAANDAMPESDIEKRLQVPFKSLAFTREIGAGNFGKVFLGQWQGLPVAIKIANEVAKTDEFLAEARLALAIAPHPNLVQTLGVSLDGPNPCIVLEFCEGGSLDKMLAASVKDLGRESKRQMALKIAYGLLHLHQNNIVHRDLAARNILLANDGTPKISDFGMSRVIKDASASGKTKATILPLRWMAPESLEDRSYSVKSDVWTYGILVWEIVTGRQPHANEDQLLIGAAIRDSGYHPAIPLECDPALRRVMEMCWQKEPEDRPTMEEITKVLREQKQK